MNNRPVTRAIICVVGFTHAMLALMKVLILYRPDSEHAREVETYVEDLQREHGGALRRVELVSVNSRDGASTASLYDILEYPSILVLADDGSLINNWNGVPLPLMEEVAGYAYS